MLVRHHKVFIQVVNVLDSRFFILFLPPFDDGLQYGSNLSAYFLALPTISKGKPGEEEGTRGITFAKD